eukprot:FR737816.1.p2 GENE.FR737816.1~~FR737816.1.p2  ORF type:complete len:137 (-),score=16.82 FR737816.1:351-761(-)
MEISSCGAVAAALELVDPLGFGPWLSLHCGRFFFFYSHYASKHVAIYYLCPKPGSFSRRELRPAAGQPDAPQIKQILVKLPRAACVNVDVENGKPPVYLEPGCEACTRNLSAVSVIVCIVVTGKVPGNGMRNPVHR